MRKMEYHTIVLEGIDKTGKDSLARYIDEVSGHRYVLPRRGVVSNIAYAKLYGRADFPEYPLDQHSHEVYVLLRCTSKVDWEMRCRLTGEAPISYEKNVAAFEEVWANFKASRDSAINLEYDTSHMTLIDIATDIVKKVDALNEAVVLI